ncbi:MAG: hypothetical protein ACRC6I_05870 [Paracoccaceae bacterium]
MTMQTDDEIDAAVRAASAFPVDEARLTQVVLTRIRDGNAGIFGLFGGHGRGAAVAFASLLVATPVLMTQVPLEAEDAAMESLLLGGGLLDEDGLAALLGGESLE